jgi:hypothetical protein
VAIAVPPARGRVTGLWTTAFIGSTPIGAVLIGAVAHWGGGGAGLAAGVAGCVAAVVVGLLLLHRDNARETLASGIVAHWCTIWCVGDLG